MNCYAIHLPPCSGGGIPSPPRGFSRRRGYLTSLVINNGAAVTAGGGTRTCSHEGGIHLTVKRIPPPLRCCAPCGPPPFNKGGKFSASRYLTYSLFTIHSSLPCAFGKRGRPHGAVPYKLRSALFPVCNMYIQPTFGNIFIFRKLLGKLLA